MKEIYASFLKKALLLVLFLSYPVFAQDFSKVDQIVSNYPKSFSKIESLASRINRDFTLEEEQARAIYTWIAFNVKYDVKSYFSNRPKSIFYTYSTEEEKLRKERNIRLDKANQALKSKIAFCEGYALLFSHVANLLGLESVMVTGSTKSSPNQIGDARLKSTHAWNAVKVNGQWKLIDVTWGAGVVNEKKRIFIPKFNPSYFFTDPEIFVLNHFPDDKRWTLGNFSMKDYVNFPFYYSSYASSQYRFLAPQSGIIIKPESNLIAFKINNLSQNDKVYYALSSTNKAQSAVLKHNDSITEFDVLLSNHSDCFLTIYINQKAVSVYKIKKRKSSGIGV